MNNIIAFLMELGVFAVVFVLFLVSLRVVKIIWPKIRDNSYLKSSRYLNPEEYIPGEELSSQIQLSFLVMITLLTMEILYFLFAWNEGTFAFAAIDILLSVYLACELENNTFTDKLIGFCLVPFGSVAAFMGMYDILVFALNLLHLAAFLYFIRVYYRKFMDYTQSNKLGITIVLLFLIIFISFIITIIVEGVSPLNSLEMVSNAFTSNGYAVMGKTSLGKLDDILLVWAGFFLSGIATATLTVSLVMSSLDDRFDHLEELARKNRKNK